MGTYESVRLIEALRSGISSRKVSSVFSKGREDILTEVRHDLECVQEDGLSRGFAFRGDYGEGKTHLLNQIFNEAEGSNFVVSLLPLSKETPFNNLKKIYPNVVAATYLPGSLMPGFEWKLRQLHPDSSEVEGILDFCRKRLHPKIELVLRNYLKEQDPYNGFRLAADMAGRFINIPNLRAIHYLNFSEALKMPRFTNEHVLDYFRFLGEFFRQVGYSGWVILFDEAELLSRLGIASRAKAYLNMHLFLFGDTEPGLVSTYTVFSFTSYFRDEIVLGGKDDINQIPLRLSRTHNQDAAQKAGAVLVYLRDKCKALRPLGEGDIRDVLSSICKLHGEAYDWDSRVDVERFVQQPRARLRSKIRATIAALDLRYLYGEDVKISIGRLEERELSEDEGFFTKEEDIEQAGG